MAVETKMKDLLKLNDEFLEKCKYKLKAEISKHERKIEENKRQHDIERDRLDIEINQLKVNLK